MSQNPTSSASSARTSTTHSATTMFGSRRDLLVPGTLVGVLALMVMPLPPLALDVLLALSITTSLVVLLTAANVVRPLDFSVFPSVLLVLTLFRLSLNVASTRLILMNGAEGGGAGALIKTFGSFVVGGNYVVGIVVFLILVLINFAVITKGSGRIAEVAARFTLDALPGKQMSIDADLSSGLIDQDEARRRRQEVAQEADFYGAMDGASKFVRGDAVAGLIITAINIIGGLVIGVAQKGLSFSEAGATYTILTVGDGLVSQIPALLISTAAGVIVSRAAGREKLGDEVSGQLFRHPQALWMASGVLLALSFLPGLPLTTFVPMALALYLLAKSAVRKAQRQESESTSGSAEVAPTEERITDILPVEDLQLEVGFQLVDLVDGSANGKLLDRIRSIRKMMARELGIVVPSIYVRDNLELRPGEYRLLLRGAPVGGAVVEPGRLLAMDPGGVSEKVRGIPTKDPAFGLDALWIDRAEKTRAERAGYTIIDPTSVVATHLTELLRAVAPDLLGRQELQDLLDVVIERTPKVVEELIPKILSTGEVIQVLRRLLAENVSIRDLRTILEAMADNAPTTRNIHTLTELVRRRLGNAICAALVGEDGVLQAALPDRPMEDILRRSLVESDGRQQLALDLPTAEALMGQIRRLIDRFTVEDRPPVLVAPSDLRAPLRELLERFAPEVHVLTHHELSPRVTLRATMTLSGADMGSRAGTTLQGGAKFDPTPAAAGA